MLGVEVGLYLGMGAAPRGAVVSQRGMDDAERGCRTVAAACLARPWPSSDAAENIGTALGSHLVKPKEPCNAARWSHKVLQRVRG